MVEISPAEFLKNIEKHIEEKRVKRIIHHDFSHISMYSYTPSAQFDPHWDSASMLARGVIIDTVQEKYLAIPFQKFFNYSEQNSDLSKISENQKHGHKVFKVKKHDGSLGILSYYENSWRMSTRGSFDSEQAKLGMQILRSKYGRIIEKLDKHCTYLFEIVSPNNKIIVHYNEDDLLLLDVVNTETCDGLELIETKQGVYSLAKNPGFPQLEFETIHEPLNFEYCSHLSEVNDITFEGFIICDEFGHRIKVKYPWYIELHRLIGNGSGPELFIRDLVRSSCIAFASNHHVPFRDIDSEYLQNQASSCIKNLDKIPDEFYEMIKLEWNSFCNALQQLDEECFQWISTLDSSMSRKDIVLRCQKEHKNLHSILALYDKNQSRYYSLLEKQIQ